MGELELTGLRQVFYNMLHRCENPKCPVYRWYGGRGIVVCERWHSFENFVEDVGKRPKGKWIDRWPDKKHTSSAQRISRIGAKIKRVDDTFFFFVR